MRYSALSLILTTIWIIAVIHNNAAQYLSFPQNLKTNNEEQIIGQPTTTTNYGMEDDLSHECLRPCLANTSAKRCFYNFKVEWYSSMSKACFDCPFNVTDCLRPHCVAIDGFERSMITVNRRFPGPSIQVCEGDEIIVDVENNMLSDTTSIHWHGLHLRRTPYMDGVPLLTQCPITPGTTFRYNFLAEKAGTHYWHSHSALQRDDGMFGAIVIRSKSDNSRSLYDIDDPKHLLVLADWMDGIGMDKYIIHHHKKNDNKPYNILINGMGKYEALENNGTMSFTPLYEISVKKDLRYRIRIIGSTVHNCPIQISFDEHNITVIASDGYNIEPVIVQSLTVYGGERWDIVLKTNKARCAYWIKFRGLMDCDSRFKSAHQVAVLRYDGAIGNPDNLNNINYKSTQRDGLELNRINAAPGDMTNFMTAADIRRSDSIFSDHVFQRTPESTFWLEFDFFKKNNHMFHHEQFYPFFEVEINRQLYIPQINHISLKLPKSPPLSQPEDVDENGFCDIFNNNYTDCHLEFCHCTHALHVPLGSLVEIILIDRGKVNWANHPFHLHGNSFAVLAMERLGDETRLRDIQLLDKLGQIKRNFKNPPIKDTVTVPDGGYTIIRFIADNPGYWLFHCHLSFHAETGMGLVFKVGDRTHLPPVPEGFPKCGSYLPVPRNDLK